MTEQDVKAARRELDGQCCQDCGLTAAEYYALRRRKLEVHRLVPDSPYTVEGTITLCKRCHKKRHVKPKPGATLVFMVTPEVRLALVMAIYSRGFRRGTERERRSAFVNELIDHYLADELHDLAPPPESPS